MPKLMTDAIDIAAIAPTLRPPPANGSGFGSSGDVVAGATVFGEDVKSMIELNILDCCGDNDDETILDMVVTLSVDVTIDDDRIVVELLGATDVMISASSVVGGIVVAIACVVVEIISSDVISLVVAGKPGVVAGKSGVVEGKVDIVAGNDVGGIVDAVNKRIFNGLSIKHVKI